KSCSRRRAWYANGRSSTGAANRSIGRFHRSPPRPRRNTSVRPVLSAPDGKAGGCCRPGAQGSAAPSLHDSPELLPTRSSGTTPSFAEGTMTNASLAQGCRAHLWERRLEVDEGVECVVGVCLSCGTRELCWSRRPLSPKAVTRVKSGIGRRTGGGV